MSWGFTFGLSFYHIKLGFTDLNYKNNSADNVLCDSAES